MKIRITFDISDKDRLLFGAKIHGKLTPASREEIEAVIHESVENGLVHNREVFDKHTADIIKAIEQSVAAQGK